MDRIVFITICCYLDCEQLSTFNFLCKMICELINYEISKKVYYVYTLRWIFLANPLFTLSGSPYNIWLHNFSLCM
jgi:hypothetical protein